MDLCCDARSNSKEDPRNKGQALRISSDDRSSGKSEAVAFFEQPSKTVEKDWLVASAAPSAESGTEENRLESTNINDNQNANNSSDFTQASARQSNFVIEASANEHDKDSPAATEIPFRKKLEGQSESMKNLMHKSKSMFGQGSFVNKVDSVLHGSTAKSLASSTNVPEVLLSTSVSDVLQIMEKDGKSCILVRDFHVRGATSNTRDAIFRRIDIFRLAMTYKCGELPFSQFAEHLPPLMQVFARLCGACNQSLQ